MQNKKIGFPLNLQFFAEPGEPKPPAQFDVPPNLEYHQTLKYKIIHTPHTNYEVVIV